jgi:hypothetical protein
MNIDLHIRRREHFWHGVTPEAVGAYLKALRKQRKLVEKNEFAIPRPFRMSTEACRDVLRLLDREIRLGEFYFELRGKMKKPDFDTWVFTKQADRKPQCGWRTPRGDIWMRTNGRVKAEIEVDATKAMTRVSLRLKNDTEKLSFYEPDGHEISCRHLRNKRSIQAEVRCLKQHADKALGEHLLPRRDAREQHLLRDLLSIPEQPEEHKNSEEFQLN